MKVIEIWTDGASRGNPGPGAYAALFYYDKELKFTTSDFKSVTTNNEMELTALHAALRTVIGFDVIYDGRFEYRLFSDSAYVVDGYNKWLSGWIKGKIIGQKANSQLWQEIADFNECLIARGIKFTVYKTKGHAGIAGNEAADKECNRLMDENTRMPEPEKVIRVSGVFDIHESGDDVIITSEALRSLNGHRVEFRINRKELIGE